MLTWSRIFKLGFTNFRRNGWLSAIAVLMMTLTLMIISFFLILNLVINTTTKSIKEKIDLSVYFTEETKDEDILSLEQILKKRPDVKEVHFISKTEALKKWRAMKIEQEVKEQISEENNPLPRSLEVKAMLPENLDSIAKYLEADTYKNMISKISYQQNKDIVERLINITKFSEKIGMILSIVFIIISILVILNTVRLAIYTRIPEIEIMRLVGASDALVKMPFIIEALLYAFISTILSLILIGIGLHYVTPMISNYLGQVNLNIESYFFSNLLLIFIFELIFSSIISIICSFISIKRYLKI